MGNVLKSKKIRELIHNEYPQQTSKKNKILKGSGHQKASL